MLRFLCPREPEAAVMFMAGVALVKGNTKPSAFLRQNQFPLGDEADAARVFCGTKRGLRRT